MSVSSPPVGESGCLYELLQKIAITMSLVVFADAIYRWIPKGQLVAHIHEHKESINRYGDEDILRENVVCYCCLSV